ncbi:hypothetical protein [Candidatus Schmidhempelia bombi]|jgi:hypothetical protein|uniref:Hemagglutinin n=1 Tax=Candidatus Schmidhempelia bombi str. Bimp TaxID=1387197 RepID=A0AB94IA60_9GAMM|nr:hypothetical protein [Candidatus Schmidhempelia bombi]TEA26267.1 hypothetical protein O970_09620 [Candidatus Schmidhempelia bombi str. Bimp]
MRELSEHEINSVSGAGIIKDRTDVKLGLKLINGLGSLIVNHGNSDKTITGIPKDYISKGINAINKTVDIIDITATGIHNKIPHKIK